jgi:hypothetical protein
MNKEEKLKAGDVIESNGVKYLVVEDYTSLRLMLVSFDPLKIVAFCSTFYDKVFEDGDYKILGEGSVRVERRNFKV